jgi:hypothetical protein
MESTTAVLVAQDWAQISRDKDERGYKRGDLRSTQNVRDRMREEVYILEWKNPSTFTIQRELYTSVLQWSPGIFESKGK